MSEGLSSEEIATLDRFQIPEELVQLATEQAIPVEDLMIQAKTHWVRSDPYNLGLARIPMVFGTLTDTVVTDDRNLLDSALNSLDYLSCAEDPEAILERFRWRIFCRLSFEIGIPETSDIFGGQLAKLVDQLSQPRTMNPHDLVLFSRDWCEFSQFLDYYRYNQPILAEMMDYYTEHYDEALTGFEAWTSVAAKYYDRLLDQE